MLWAAFCLAFYGFLRAGEFTTPQAHSVAEHTLRRKDLRITTTAVDVTIKASKTDPFRQGHTLHIAPTATSTCPAAALSKYLAVSRIAAEAPLFQFADGSYLTRRSLTEHLRVLLTAGGYSSSLFASHSFRIGAATTAAAAGLPDWLIQALGRWSSNCYTLYIRTPPHVIAAASAKLATFSACPSATPH